MAQSPPWHPDRLTARLPFLRRRGLITAATRAFFTARGYTEVETPIIVPTPGEEVHLNVFATTQIFEDGSPSTLKYLHTSPEFAMKKLLAGGAGPIFQLARVFRNGERSARHSPEFTMLEWYRPHADFFSLIDETEAYLAATLPPHIALPAERLTIQEAFQLYAGIDLLAAGDDANRLATCAGIALRGGETWEDLFFRLLLERIEPHLGRTRPTLLTHWPAAQAALARRDPADPRVALRFELFINGVEIANAFEELTDPAEQRARFLADRARRHAIRGEEWPMDEDLLAALTHGIPPCSGIALGFDRLCMLATGATRVDDVLWLPGD